MTFDKISSIMLHIEIVEAQRDWLILHVLHYNPVRERYVLHHTIHNVTRDVFNWFAEQCMHELKNRRPVCFDVSFVCLLICGQNKIRNAIKSVEMQWARGHTRYKYKNSRQRWESSSSSSSFWLIDKLPKRQEGCSNRR